MRSIDARRRPTTTAAAKLEFRRAEALMRRGDATGAVRLLEPILHENPQFVPALELMAKARWQRGEHRCLVELLPRLLQLNPYEPGYLVLMGASLQALGRLGEACRAYERAGSVPEAIEGTQRLIECQAMLIGELLAEDRAFRAAYAQDPDRALEARGFYFPTLGASSPRWVSAERRPAQFLARPS